MKLFGGLGLLVFLIYVGNTHAFINPQVPAVAKVMDPFGGFWQQAEGEISAGTSHQVLSSIQGTAAIDQKGVPHIFASNIADAVYIQGYMHAKDRLFQMDVSTRAAGGSLAEVLGPNLIERDRIQRRKGMRIAAQRTLDAWLGNTETAKIVKAYSDGINAYISSLRPRDFPVEYKILGFKPEAWTIMKSALMAKSMAESLCFRNFDLATTNTRAILGDSLFAHLYPEHNPEESPIIPATKEWTFNPIEIEATDNSLSEQLSFPMLEQAPEGIGSNNWALSGAKTASGAPLLSNDPHLPLTLPSIWYEVQIHTPQMNVYGVSLPALPGVLIGFNESSAWGITNVGHDVLDWYKITWTDNTRQYYLLDGEAVEPDWKTDTIWVRGQKNPEIVKTPWTVFGPLVYDQPDNQHYNLAMRWLAHDAPFSAGTDNIDVFLQLGTNNGLDAYTGALSGFDTPASNMVYANQNNDIALTVAGRLPLKADQQGRFVQAGNSRSQLWQGFVPFAHLPRVANPVREYVSSANQRSTDTTYPYYYNGGFEDYRGRYINRRLEQMNNATPKDMMDLQLDAYSLKAEEALPAMLKALAGAELTKEQEADLSLLKQWDFVYTGKQQAPVLFNSWYDSLYLLTFDEIYKVQREDFRLEKPEAWRFIQLLESENSDPIFDIQNTGDKVETREELAVLAFQQASRAVHDQLEKGLDWSTHRATNIPHLARIPGFESGLITTDGAKNTPNSMASAFAPSWRMVVSLEKPVRAWGVLPGGPSGNVGSPFYTIGLEEWSKGEYFELKLYSSVEEVGALELYHFE